MADEIWALVEHWRGTVSEITFETLALGRELAASSGAGLQAVLLGSAVADMIPALGAADSVVLVEHVALAEPVPDMYALALAQLMQARRPQALLIPQTNLMMELGSLVAARLALPFINFCRDAQWKDGVPVARCVLYGGKVEATVAPRGTPVVLGILPGTRASEPGRVERTPPATPVAVELPPESPVRFRGYTEPPAGDVDVTQQKILVAVGRGIQRAENVTLAEELARALGGAVCGSRPVIDQGWLPASRQVGTSGMIVAPQLYLALGISGAPEHIEGMKRSELIVAVNSDSGAPIFSVAHYGVTADLFDILPALIQRVKAVKTSKAA